MLIPIDNHVQALVNRANPLALELLNVLTAQALHFNVLGRGDAPLLLHSLAIDKVGGLIGIGVSAVATCSNDTRLDHLLGALLTEFRSFKENLDNFRFFEVLL